MRGGNGSSAFLENLVQLEDKLDCKSGASPVDLYSKELRKLTWIFDPYTEIIPNLHAMNANLMGNTLEAVFRRMELYEQGDSRPDAIEIKTAYRNVKETFPDIAEPCGYAFVTEESQYTRDHAC